MNKFSDNLRLRSIETLNMQLANTIDGEVTNFKVYDNCSFILKLNASAVNSFIRIEIVESKDQRGIEDPRVLFVTETFAIPGQMPRYYAFDVKAEDLSHPEGYGYARMQVHATGALATPVLATIFNLEGSQHFRSTGAGVLYDGVFDRQHLEAPVEVPPLPQ